MEFVNGKVVRTFEVDRLRVLKSKTKYSFHSVILPIAARGLIFCGFRSRTMLYELRKSPKFAYKSGHLSKSPSFTKPILTSGVRRSLSLRKFLSKVSSLKKYSTTPCGDRRIPPTICKMVRNKSFFEGSEVENMEDIQTSADPLSEQLMDPG